MQVGHDIESGSGDEVFEIEYSTTAETLRAMLGELHPADRVVIQEVGILMIMREGLQIGQIDLTKGREGIEWWED